MNNWLRKLKFSIFKVKGQIIDLDGNCYSTIKIGNQTWLNQNLNVSRFRNGDLIFEAKSHRDWWLAHEKKIPAWSYFDHENEKNEKYGKYYNWYAVNDPRGLSPEGFIIPSNRDWEIMETFIGGSENGGSKLKSKSFEEEPEEVLNDEYGFSALPSGFVFNGEFDSVGEFCCFWTSTPLSLNNATIKTIHSGRSFIKSGFGSKMNGCSVRCIKKHPEEIIQNNNELYENQNESLKTKLQIKKKIISEEVIEIGRQTWLARNLNVTSFLNEEPINYAKTKEEWLFFCDERLPAYCYYDFNEIYGEVYGKLYNIEVVAESGELFEEGWVIPNEDDWKKLIQYLGGSNFAGEKMKSENGWENEGFGTNESGFSAKPGGSFSENENFSGLGLNCSFWSNINFSHFMSHIPTEFGLISLFWNDDFSSYFPFSVKGYQRFKNYEGHSIRCIKKFWKI